MFTAVSEVGHNTYLYELTKEVGARTGISGDSAVNHLVGAGATVSKMVLGESFVMILVKRKTSHIMKRHAPVRTCL